MSIPCESDRASIAEQNFLNQAMMLSKQSAPSPLATGECLWCEVDVSDQHRWCGASCRDAWDKDQKRLKSLGR